VAGWRFWSSILRQRARSTASLSSICRSNGVNLLILQMRALPGRPACPPRCRRTAWTVEQAFSSSTNAMPPCATSLKCEWLLITETKAGLRQTAAAQGEERHHHHGHAAEMKY